MGKKCSRGGLRPGVFKSSPKADYKGEIHYRSIPEKAVSSSGDQGHVGKKGNRGHRRRVSRLLLNLLLSLQKRWGVPTHPESAAVKQVSVLPQVQDGDERLNSRTCFERGLVGQSGPKGCVLPRSSLATTQAIPKICLRRPGVSVPSSAIRPFLRPEGVHKSARTLGGSYTSQRNSVSTLFRRLSFNSKVQRGFRDSCSRSHVYPRRSRLHYKPYKVSLGSDPRSSVFRNETSNRSGGSVSNARPDSRYSQMCQEVPSEPLRVSQIVSTVVGIDGGLPVGGTQCPASHAPSPNVSTHTLESILSKPVTQDSSIQSAGQVFEELERPSFAGEGCVASTSGSHDYSYHRCLDQGLGRALSRPQGPGSLVRTTESTSHQSSRDAGSSVCLPSISESSPREISPVTNRQYLSSPVRKQGGGYKISGSLHSSPQVSHLVPISPDCGDGSSSGRNKKLPSRLPVPTFRLPDRVGTRPLGRLTSVPSLGGTVDGSVCNFSQHSDSSLLQLAPRPTSVLDRRSVHAMEVDLRLRVSSIGINTEGRSKSPERAGRADPYRSQLAQPVLVSTATQSLSGPPTPVAFVPRVVDPAGGNIAPLQSSRLVPGSMEDKRRFLVAQGLSPEVAQTIIASRAPGTYRGYESRWKNFATWCRRKGFNPFDTTVAQILDYLQHCLTTLKLKHSTIRGRVFAIALFHRQFPLEKLSRHEWVKAFIKGAKRLCPKQTDILPAWSLQWVLQALRGAPFEPWSPESLHLLSWKVAFLLAVTTAKRLGELQALSSHKKFTILSEQGVRLRLNPSFIPKVNKVEYRELETLLVPFCPPRRGAETHSTHYRICPVRAIRLYLQATADFRRTDQLFVCYSGPRRGYAASKITIARWIRSCIQHAYKAIGKPLPTGLKAHQTRSVAASWAQFNGSSIADICKTATWSDGCTFARFYQLNLAGNTATARFANNVLQTVLDGSAQ